MKAHAFAVSIALAACGASDSQPVAATSDTGVADEGTLEDTAPPTDSGPPVGEVDKVLQALIAKYLP